MVLENIVGPNGDIVSFIEQVIPGGTAFIMLILIFLFIIFALRARSFTENTSEIITYFVVISALIFILSGSLFHLVIVIIALFFIEYANRVSVYHAELGTGSEREAIIEAGYPYAEEKRAILKEEAMEQEDLGKEPLERAATKAERALAEEEERQIELELHEEAIAASTDKIAKTVTTLQDREIELEKRNEKMEATITAIDKQLAGMENRLAIDEAGQTYLLAFAKQLASALEELVKDKLYENEYREKALEQLKKSVKIIGVAVKEAQRIENRALQVERQLERLGPKEIQAVKNEVKNRQRKFEKIKKLYRSVPSNDAEAKKAAAEQMVQAKQQLGQIQTEEVKLDSMNDELQQALRRLRSALKKLKRGLRQMKNIEKEAQDAEKEMNKFEGEFKSAISEMRRAQADFGRELGRLETELPEEIAIKTTKDVGTVYTRILELAKKTLSFNKDMMQPFISSTLKVINEAEDIAKSSYYVNFFFIRIEQAFEELDQLAAAVAIGERIRQKIFKELKEEKIQEGLSRYIADQGKKNVAMMQAAAGNLEGAQKKILDHETYLNKEILEAEVEEKTTLNALTRLTKTLMNRKTKIHKEFMEDAINYSQRIKQAKEATAAARAYA